MVSRHNPLPTLPRSTEGGKMRAVVSARRGRTRGSAPTNGQDDLLLIHPVPHLFPRQRPAARLGALHPHVHHSFLTVERGMGVNDDPVAKRILRVAPRDKQ